MYDGMKQLEYSTEQAIIDLYEATLSKVPIDSIQAVTITADEGDYARLSINASRNSLQYTEN